MSNPYDPNASSNPYGAPQGGGYGQGGDGGYGNPYGQNNPYGNEPPKKTDAVSIIGFILSLTCCLSIVGAIMGFVGLGRTKGGKRKGRWAAIAASIIGILGTIAAVAIGLIAFVFVDSLVTVDEAKAGVCINIDDNDDEAVIFYEKKCDEKHDGEIVYAGDAGDDAQTLETGDVGTVCQQRVTEATPDLVPILSGGDYTLSAVIEDPNNVSADDRLVCYVEPTTGSLNEKLTP